MSRAGTWLRPLASRLYSAPTMERLIDPLLADMRYEEAQAVEQGSRWRTWRARGSGYLAFWTAVLLHGVFAAPRSAFGFFAAERWLAGRVAGAASLIFAAVTVLLILPPLLHGIPLTGGRTAVYLVPQAMALAVPIALSAAVAYGYRGRRPSPHIVVPVLVLALCGTAAGLTTREWLMPTANEAFRVAVATQFGNVVEGVQGPSELSLTALATRIDELGAEGSAAEAAKLSRVYQLHWSLGFTSIGLSLFSLGVSTFARRRILTLVAGLGAPLAYWACLGLVETAVVRGAAPATVWLPNGLFLACGVVLLVMRRTRWRPSR